MLLLDKGWQRTRELAKRTPTQRGRERDREKEKEKERGRKCVHHNFSFLFFLLFFCCGCYCVFCLVGQRLFTSLTSRTTRSRCGNARASPINTTWKMIHCTNKSLNVLYYIFALHCVRSVLCSEFPERECCDTVYSAIPNPEPAPTSPTLLTHIIPSTITANHTGNYI